MERSMSFSYSALFRFNPGKITFGAATARGKVIGEFGWVWLITIMPKAVEMARQL